LGPAQSGVEQRLEVADGLRTPAIDEFAMAPYPIDSFVFIHDTQKYPSREDWYLTQVLETDPEGGGTLLVWVYGTYQQSKAVHERLFFRHGWMRRTGRCFRPGREPLTSGIP
jgi:hypothetical protein